MDKKIIKTLESVRQKVISAINEKVKAWNGLIVLFKEEMKIIQVDHYSDEEVVGIYNLISLEATGRDTVLIYCQDEDEHCEEEVNIDLLSLNELYDLAKHLPDKNPKQLRSGYWHGEDAWILEGSAREGYNILVGGHTSEEANAVLLRLKEDKSIGDYDDYVVFAEPDEWKEQNS